MCEAGYPCGLLIAPVILVDDWKKLYTELLEELESGLSVKMKREMFLEIILMTYPTSTVPLIKMPFRGRKTYTIRRG